MLKTLLFFTKVFYLNILFVQCYNCIYFMLTVFLCFCLTLLQILLCVFYYSIFLTNNLRKLVFLLNIFNYLFFLFVLIMKILFKSFCGVFLLVFFLARYESYKIFNKPAFKVDGYRYLNDCIYPPIVDSVSENTLMSKLLYSSYKLYVFNLVYNRVVFGRYFFFKMLTFTSISTTLFYYLSGISGVAVFFSTQVYKLCRGASFVDILATIFLHSNDNRKLVRINNVWVANGGLDDIAKLFSGAFRDFAGKTITLSSKQELWLRSIIHQMLLDRTFRINQKAIFLSEVSKTPHVVTKNICKDNGCSSLMTDKVKALINNNYNKQSTIFSFWGGKKESVGLLQKNSEIKLISVEMKVDITNQVRGAAVNGYNSDLLTDRFNHQVEQELHLFKELHNFIQDLGADMETTTFVSKLDNAILSSNDYYEIVDKSNY